MQAKLKESQRAQLEGAKAIQAAELKAQSVDLEIVQQVNARLSDIQVKAKSDAEEHHKLRIAELEKKLADTASDLADTKRKMEQGSQQLQGEVLELDLHIELKSAFPWDQIDEVKKGQRGGDLTHRVMVGEGITGGSIMWETKRAQYWGADWCSKAKDDARRAKNDIVVIVSTVLPKDCTHFAPYDGIWVTKPEYSVMLAHVLRSGILDNAKVRQSALGKQDKAEILYDYLTGSEFHARMQGIVEPFIQMQRELETE